MSSDTILKRTIEELNISVRAYNCLKNQRINTVGELIEKTEKELLLTKNFGRKSVNELRDLLSSLGLSFRQ